MLWTLFLCYINSEYCPCLEKEWFHVFILDIEASFNEAIGFKNGQIWQPVWPPEADTTSGGKSPEPQQQQSSALVKDAEEISEEEIDFDALEDMSQEKFSSEMRKLRLEEKRIKLAREKTRLEIETTILKREKEELQAARAKKLYYRSSYSRRYYGYLIARCLALTLFTDLLISHHFGPFSFSFKQKTAIVM